MSLSLVEAAKLASGDVHRSSVIEQYARSSDVLRVLPFQDIKGNALKYNREETLPGIAFRGINESYTESTGVINPITESLFISGGDMDVDMQVIASMGEGVRAAHEMMKVKAQAGLWTKKFFKGDTGTEPREFDGLQLRLTGSQKIAPAAATANGSALSLQELDKLIDAVTADGQKYLVMNKTLRRRLSAAARLYTVGGYLTYELDAFGRSVTKYNDVPILIADQDNTGTDILAFDEACTSGTATGSSVYCVAVGDMAVSGIQNGGMDVRDLGELQTKPAKRTRVEWFSGIAVFNSRSAARLWSIADAAVVV